jgi:rhamnulose-1-phosphate aldolase
MIEQPYPSLESLLEMIGDAGKRMFEIEACEGSAGNISVCLGWDVDPRSLFPQVETVTLPQPAPELAGKTLIVTGSGRRLSDISTLPLVNLACLVVNPGGLTAEQYTAPQRGFSKVTSEFNSHLAAHADRVPATGSNFHAVIHVHPPYLTYLSYIPRYQDQRYLNLHLLRWQPETIVNLPEGIGFAQFEVPASRELVAAGTSLLGNHQVVIWSKHGVMACSASSVKKATNLVEYVESAARYEYLNLGCGEPGQGLSAEEIRAICAAFGVQQSYF